jgi:hypothetical protein
MQTPIAVLMGNVCAARNTRSFYGKARLNAEHGQTRANISSIGGKICWPQDSLANGQT